MDFTNKGTPKGNKNVKQREQDNNTPKDEDSLAKKAKMEYLAMLAGPTAGNVTSLGPLHKLKVNAKKQVKKMPGPSRGPSK